MIEEAPDIIIHTIIMALRSLPYFSSIFFSSYHTFFEEGFPAFEFMDIVSVLYNFCPASFVMEFSGYLWSYFSDFLYRVYCNFANL
jgi:hypothetical protein